MTPVRFIIITVPPPEIAAVLETARDRAAALTGAVAALAYPPHVTLRTGALVPPDAIGEFAGGLSTALGVWAPFAIQAEGLFHAPYASPDGGTRHMVGWRIAADRALLDLHRALLSYDRFQVRAQPEFEPHLTLAFDDLSEPEAQRLLQHARSLPETYPPSLSWSCASVGLYRKAEERWEPYYEFEARGIRV